LKKKSLVGVPNLGEDPS